MKKTQAKNEFTAELIQLTENLQDLSSQINYLRKQIAAMPVTLPPFSTSAYSKSKIIPFPVKSAPVLTPVKAVPGSFLPLNVPDCRPLLQRDGLILLAWDKRDTEKGERFTAYWVTSVGIPRFYASKPLIFKDLSSARPHHKSYAAEDGIEFYGQKPPAYIVHVAPELMKSNPRHKELRAAHINLLKLMGSNENFNYKYLLKTEKNRKKLPKTSSKTSSKTSLKTSSKTSIGGSSESVGSQTRAG